MIRSVPQAGAVGPRPSFLAGPEPTPAKSWRECLDEAADEVYSAATLKRNEPGVERKLQLAAMRQAVELLQEAIEAREGME